MTVEAIDTLSSRERTSRIRVRPSIGVVRDIRHIFQRPGRSRRSVEPSRRLGRARFTRKAAQNEGKRDDNRQEHGTKRHGVNPRGRLSARTHVVAPETGQWENSNRLADKPASTSGAEHEYWIAFRGNSVTSV